MSQDTHKKEISMETDVGQLVWTSVKEGEECSRETKLISELDSET